MNTLPARVLYFQVTMGHAHLARVRALSQLTGISCLGVQFAEREATRGAEGAAGELRTIAHGVYEEIPKHLLVLGARKIAKQENASVAILDCPADAVQFATGVLLQGMGIPTLVRWASTRADYPRLWWREALKRPVYSRWDGYLVTGERAAEYLESFGVSRTQSFVCGNPVGSGFAPINPGQGDAQRDDAFLFVGRFIWHKNLLGLLEAFEHYRLEGGRFSLRLAGGGTGEHAAEVERRARQVRGVEMLGFLSESELQRQYAIASCLVLPSVSENWGLVVNEALQSGLPVVVSDRVGCIPELVADGVNGLIVDPESSRSIADALHRMERMGPEQRKTMGAAGAVKVARQSVDDWARRVRAAIAEVRRR